MYASGIPFNGNTVNERSLGGSESAAYYVAKEFAKRGHRVSVFTESQDQGTFDGVQYLWVGPKDQRSPLGANWHFFCENTPHDVCLMQRVPFGFHYTYQSKINLLWLHDIALRRNNDSFMSGQWQMSRLIPVSNWFKNQIADTWLVDRERISPIHNGVDYSLFDGIELKENADRNIAEQGITMIYCSRPERGLENLVMPGMIMDQLKDKAPHIKLKVCGYEHSVPELQGYYNMLFEQIDTLPNCEHIGSLTKSDLYRMMCQEADVWCYPTQFEETSCITAMECMAAGLSIFTTDAGALAETIGDYSNCAVIPNTDEGVQIDRFVERLSKFNNVYRRKPKRDFTWERTVDELEEIIEDCFAEATENKDALARHYLRNSDIYALDDLLNNQDAKISDEVVEQLPLYDFRFNWQDYAEHYADGTEEMYDGPSFTYEPPEFVNHPRFVEVAKRVSGLQEGSVVLDYGCAHGHFTNYLADQFPAITFVGIDVSPKAIAVAEEKASELNLENVTYKLEDWLADDGCENRCDPPPDLVILGEILEHVPSPTVFMETVRQTVGNVPCIITTPFGPWEEMSYQKDHPKRFHLHHLERDDLLDLFGHLDVSITCLANGYSQWGEVIGWYITDVTLKADEPSSMPIDYERKHKQQRPRQTVSYCGIVKDGQYDLPRLLRTIEPICDELIIGVDETTSDSTRAIITAFSREHVERHRTPRLRVEQFEIPSAVKIGFDAARNHTIAKANCDWILWGDADEEFVGAERMPKYLRPNGWQGYGIAQHHFSCEPTAVLSTDYPVRLFRRNPDVRFLGVVHEHPENIHTPNKGVDFAWVNHEMHFAHGGYATEAVRRRRFERNVSLMARDREQNPDRILGAFLWIRDLALMNRFELEQTQGGVTSVMQERALVGLQLWEKTMDDHGSHPQVKRMIRDHLEFYDVLVNCMDRGFTFRFKFASGPGVDAPQLSQVPELSARFLNTRHLDKFLSVLIDDEVNSYEEKYL
jgi:glycosyltransferase involved in cell wall biosynthesis/2-polyprenyl-3-methyl-5-hydroxy-6-metoxy-1,4-benzoquinol methylase